ncbi:MAG TPA: polysaccharide deacetylase family protein [Candidatus Nitrosopolaris sp.]|nr:polysaccharide deacetylase family protein [Candidatus Nitrosopolaris sp.]
MQYSSKIKNFPISGLIVATALMMVCGMLSIPHADSKPSIITTGSSGGKPIAKPSHGIQTTSSKSIVSGADNSNNNTSNINGGNNDRVVIINFDDSFKNQFLYAKPILDKYGLKATFFEVCGWIGKYPVSKKSWQDIAALKQDGMDIESHTMTHAHLNTLSTAELNYQIGQSKQCLLNHGFATPIFAYPYSEGSNNITVVKVVAGNYDLARTDSGFPLTFLHCNGFKNHPQTDCKTYSGNGKKLTFDNRYSIKSWTHRHIDGSYSSEEGLCAGVCHSYNNAQMFQRFVADVNSQIQYNKNGIVNAIPIVIYHNIVNFPDVSFSKDAADTTINLFDQEMRYLHDNGFKVLRMNQLGYDTTNHFFYIKNVPIANPAIGTTAVKN